MMYSKNLHVAALAAAMMALSAQASLVSSNDVIGAVSAWADANGATFTAPGFAECATPTYGDDGETVLYWTVKMSNGGAVIASPDSDLDLVVAVLEKYDGPLPAGHTLPAILKQDMTKRLAAIAERNAAAGGGRRKAGAAAQTQAATPLDGAVRAANAQWAKYGVGGGMKMLGDSLDDGDSSPYVRRIVDGFEQGGRYTHWNQGKVNGDACYNRYTPQNAVCGCVATAGSAILQFFNCTNDIGTVVGSPTYGLEMEPASNYRNRYGPCNITIAGAIDWSILPKRSFGGAKEGSDVLDEAGYDLLGRVAYNMGVLVNMGWDMAGPGTESGAQTAKLAEAFKAYGFKTARAVSYSGKKDTDGVEFIKTIYAQVWCGAPVALGISTEGKDGGHAVVACGYARDPDGDEFCRVFMGWAGSGDAWYKFPQIDSFNQVNVAVTMIGYQDDAVVPVYGEANIPGVDLVLPGYVTNGVPVTVPVNENGFFGIRVPADITDWTIKYEPRNKSADITPFESEVLTDEGASRENLDAAIPDEIMFSILNATVKSTMESGRAVAERDGKALLMVSGLSGTTRTKALMEYLYWLDDTTDFSNKFVLVFNNVKSPDLNRRDGNPGIGVFDPVGFEAGERWQEVNERLAYEAFIDSELTGETNEVVYTFSETNTVAMTNGVDEVLAVGYDAYLRRHSGITVTITGVDANSGTNAPFEVATVVPGYGVCSNCFVDGEVAVFTAPGTVTNLEEGTIMSCVGWTTDEISPTEGVTNYNPGAEAEIELSAGDEVTLTWVWDVTHYRVRAEKMERYGTDNALVSPAESWVRAGGRVTIEAEASTGNGRTLSAFVVETDEDQPADYEARYSDDALLYENGTMVSFSVYEPVKVTAIYNGRTPPEEPDEWSFTLKAEPAEMQDELPLPMGGAGALEWGEHTGYDAIVSLSPGAASYTDSTGGVWVCTGWIVNGQRLGGPELTAYAMGTITCVWGPQEQEESDDPVPGPITISALGQDDDGYWVITVSGVVKGCWYWLHSTGDLSSFAGEDDEWVDSVGLAETMEDNPQQALEDGDIEFHVVPPEDTAQFWRARATSKEDGD